MSTLTKRQAGPSIKFSKREDLIVLKDLIEAGTVAPLIDRTYPLSQTAQALNHVAGGHARGTVVLIVKAADMPDAG